MEELTPEQEVAQALEASRMAIDLQLPSLCEVLERAFEDEALVTVSESCRYSYVQGYRDGAQNPFFLDQFGEDEIDFRLLDIWMETELALMLDEEQRSVLIQSLRFAWCRGFLDATGEQPFGSPTDNEAVLAR